MSNLLHQIRCIDARAARIMEEADLRSNSEIQSLTREDLRDLFPGPKDMKLRRNIFETISKHDPMNELLKDLQGFIPIEDLKDALSNDGVLVRYLRILKDMKAHLNSMQRFVDANISFLEDISNAPSEQGRDHGTTSNVSVNQRQTRTRTTSTQTSPYLVAMESNKSWSLPSSFNRPQKLKVTVKYKMVVSGKTFNAHQQILDQIRGSGEELNLFNVEENQSIDDCQIILVFCPIVSRVGTDVEAAMRTVLDKRPVIMVLMHHTHEARHVASMRTWTENLNIVFHVNVFYHEKIPGLVSCKENSDAVTAIRNELMKYGEHSECSAGSSTSASAANDSASRRDNQTGYILWPPSKWGQIG